MSLFFCVFEGLHLKKESSNLEMRKKSCKIWIFGLYPVSTIYDDRKHIFLEEQWTRIRSVKQIVKTYFLEFWQCPRPSDNFMADANVFAKNNDYATQKNTFRLLWSVEWRVPCPTSVIYCIPIVQFLSCLVCYFHHDSTSPNRYRPWN